MKMFFRFLLFLSLNVAAFGTDYYVDPDDGNDGNAGTSAALAWATLAYATDTVAAGDRVFIEGPAGYEYTTQDGANNCVLHITTNGANAVNAMIMWIGCSDINEPNDGGVVVIDASDNTLGYACLAIGSDHNTFMNIHFKGASTACWSGSAEEYVGFSNCRFSDSGGSGVSIDKFAIFTNCVFDNNAGDGANVVADYVTFIDCVFWRNGDDGVELTGGVIKGCLSADNTTKQINYDGAANAWLVDTIVDGNNVAVGIGMNMGATIRGYCVQNCLIYDCTTGLLVSQGTHIRASAWNNCFYSNTNNVYSGASAEDFANPDYDLSYIYGNYEATSDPFGSDPGTDDFSQLMDNYVIAANEYPSGAKKAGHDVGVTKDHWKDVEGGTNPAGNAEAPRGNKDIGGEQTTESTTGAFSQNKSGNKS